MRCPEVPFILVSLEIYTELVRRFPDGFVVYPSPVLSELSIQHYEEEHGPVSIQSTALSRARV